MTEGPGVAARVLLLRHGKVAHHRGDVALTDVGREQARAAGGWFADRGIAIAHVLHSDTKRARETAEQLADANRAAGGRIDDVRHAVALRNPDLYLGGHRVNIAEGAEAIAAQSPPSSEDDVTASAFWSGLLTAPDRVGYWLEHGSPPGDDAHAVGRRIDHAVRSVADAASLRGRTIVAISHSPVLRAVWLHHRGAYVREPPFLHGHELTLSADGQLTLQAFATGTGDVPTTATPGPDEAPP